MTSTGPSVASATTTPDQTLEHWLAQERATQALLERSGPGVARPDQIAGKSGLDMLHAMLRGELPYPPIAQTLSFLLLEAEAGRALFQGTPGAAHLNPMGTIHGGWYATLLDSALGCAVQTRLPPGQAYTTAELGLNIVKAINPKKAPRVRAEATVLHCGRQLATAEAKLYGPDGTLYAHATTTCLVFEHRAG
jgi:uncharacterized protein (TIGR00369 family)